jgi:hypothetical protein
MNRAEQYRERAKECLAFSTSIGDPMWRAQLVSMAAEWRELAHRKSQIARSAEQTTRHTRRVERIKSAQAIRA